MTFSRYMFLIHYHKHRIEVTLYYNSIVIELEREESSYYCPAKRTPHSPALTVATAVFSSKLERANSGRSSVAGGFATSTVDITSISIS